MKGVFMNKNDKIDAIIDFVTSHPESTASRTIMRRYFLSNDMYESSKELGFELKDILQKEEKDEIDFCYYLVK